MELEVREVEYGLRLFRHVRSAGEDCLRHDGAAVDALVGVRVGANGHLVRVLMVAVDVLVGVLEHALVELASLDEELLVEWMVGEVDVEAVHLQLGVVDVAAEPVFAAPLEAEDAFAERVLDRLQRLVADAGADVLFHDRRIALGVLGGQRRQRQQERQEEFLHLFSP